MLLRLLLPYFMLAVFVLGYLVFRQFKLGSVVVKIERQFLSNTNNDSLILILILAAASYFLMRYELNNLPFDAEGFLFGPYTFAIFYLVLLAAVVAREVERPQVREKGLATSRGFWLWSEVESFRWSKDILNITISKGKRKREEMMQVDTAQKRELTRLLKEMIPKRAGKGKKKR